MPLTDDQRAMLRLLLEREQSYGDIATLLGLDVDQVRARARSALGEIAGREPSPAVADYLLGQAGAEGSAAAVKELRANGSSLDLAEQLAAQLQLLAPKSRLPALPGHGAGEEAPARGDQAKAEEDETAAESGATAGAEGGERSMEARATARAEKQATREPPAREPTAEPRRPAPRAPRRRDRLALSSTRSRLVAAVAGVGVVVIIVLLAAGVFSGGGSDSSQADGAGSSASGGSQRVTQAVLSPVGGGDARGLAVFSRFRNTPILQVVARGMEPSSGGDSYAIWLYGSKKASFLLTTTEVPKSGNLAVQLALNEPILALIARQVVDSVHVSLARSSKLKAELAAARRGRRVAIPLTGEDVLQGPITGPLVGAASRAR